MELIESLTRQDADLGSTFISEKEVTLKLNGEDLKNLLAYKEVFTEFNGQLSHKPLLDQSFRSLLTEEQIETMRELLGILLEGVSNYDLV
jgi:hypothetical protein